MSAEVVTGLLWGALTGVALGIVFFVGLWATVRRVTRSQRPWAWLASSFMLRLVVVVAGLWLVSRGGIWPLAGALVGFIVARPVVTSLVVRRRDSSVQEPARPDATPASSGSEDRAQEERLR